MEGKVAKGQGQRWLRPATDKEEYFAVGHQKCGYGLSAYSISLTSSKPLTEDLIKRALVHLYKKVPVLRLCLGQREGRLWLREMNECILDFKVLEGGVESEVEERLMYHTFNTVEGPMWCVRFVPATQGHGGLVILCFHHTATDGITNIRICNMLHIILDDLIAERHIDDEEQLGEHMGDEEAKMLYERERQRLAQDPDLYKRRKEELITVDKANTPLLSVLNYPYDERPKTCSAKVILEEATTKAFRQTCKSNGVSLHSGLVGIVNVAMLRMLEDLPNAPPEYNFVCSHDVGLRRYYKGDTSRILGLHLPTFSYRMSFITPKDLIHRFWPYMREYNDRFHADLKDKAPLQAVILRLMDKSKEDNFKECFGQMPEPEYSYAISNTGDVSLMIPGNGDFVQVTKLGRLSTVRESVVLMCFFVHTYRGRLNITMGYSTHFMTRNIAQQLLSFMHEAMKQLCH